MSSPGNLTVRVGAIAQEARDVLRYEFWPLVHAGMLPPFEPGAHIDLHLPNGLRRSYSLLNACQERHRYVVAIHNAADSRGGANFIHKTVREGDLLTISQPKQNFSLNEEATSSVFIAGGIGITPLWSMIQRLEQLGRPWTLHYAARSRMHAALLNEITTPSFGNVSLAFSEEGERLDLRRIVEALAPDTHLYCCGPTRMMEAFEIATEERHADTLHVEHFGATRQIAFEGGFTIELARSGHAFIVPPGKTILAAMREKGFDVPFACEQGVCGTCEIEVLEGIPDHLDLFLSKAEKQSNKSILVCCSGSKTSKLVLNA